jgi:predicted lipoprotein with Yx(FWY)xxD motif
LILTLALAAAACGDDSGAADGEPRSVATQTTPRAVEPAQTIARAARPQRRGTTIALRESDFGRILFDGRGQAIYVFENDRRNRSVCSGDCAAAWPPVYTRGAPRAAGGVRAALLGTIRRRDGRRQVTYAGRPLYFYAHEGRGEVRCHNVDLNGGLWWVVGRDGRRRP